MKKPELIMHIGYPKTGSTALQTSFINNSELLMSKGIYFGEYFGNQHVNFFNELIKDAFDNYLGVNFCESALNNGYRSAGSVELLAERMIRHFHHNKCDRLIITSEHLISILKIQPSRYTNEKVDAEKLGNMYIYIMDRIKEVFQDFHIKIVYYVRRQDLWIESSFGQAVRQNGILDNNKNRKDSLENMRLPDLNSICKKKILDYYDCATKFAQGFGKENVIIKPYEKGQISNDIVYDFYSTVLGFSNKEISELKKENDNYINKRLNRDVMEYKIKCAEMNFELENSWKYERVSDLMGNTNAYHSYYSFDEKKHIMDIFAETNEKLAREFLGRVDGMLFYEGLSEDENMYPGLSVDTTIKIANELAAINNRMMSEQLSSLMADTESFMRQMNLEVPYIARLEKLITYAVCRGSGVLVYGVRGNMAHLTFQKLERFHGLHIVGVADRAEKCAFYNGNARYTVYEYDELEQLAPDIIIIASQYSGKDIYDGLMKLNLSNTKIFPLYDLGDEIWNVVI